MKIAIIGAGAAGCFAAANIPTDKVDEVVIFEKSAKALQKVKVSGGGRCNVTHACFEIPELIKRYPRGKNFLKKTLSRFSPNDTIQWFEDRGVELKTESDGRMFPVSNDSQTIIDCIWTQLQKNKVSVRFGKAVKSIEKAADRLEVSFLDGSQYMADKVLIACGGFPKQDQYKWINELGHTNNPPVPSLFTFNLPNHPIRDLMGISVEQVTLKVQGTKLKESGPILITHWGMSGPAVLKTSAWAARQLQEMGYDFHILINWLNDTNDEELGEIIKGMRIDQGKSLVYNKSPFTIIPRRLWEYFLKNIGVSEETKWGEMQAAHQRKLIETLLRDSYHVSGKTTFKEEFVTAGGVTLSEVDSKDMQSKVIPNLYFAGEILDVDGVTGGFNFQHAWSSAYIAAMNIV